MQVTAGSILGVFGPGAKHRAERMLRNGWIHIVASDAHDASERSPAMGHARRVLAKRGPHIGAISGHAIAFSLARGWSPSISAFHQSRR